MKKFLSDSEESLILQSSEELGFIYEKIGADIMLTKYLTENMFYISLFLYKTEIYVQFHMNELMGNQFVWINLETNKEQLLKDILPNINVFCELSKEIFDRSSKRNFSHRGFGLFLTEKDTECKTFVLNDTANMENNLDDCFKSNIYLSEDKILTYEFISS